MDLIIKDIATSIDRATTVVGACQDGLDTLALHTDVMSAVLLHVRDQLRCIAASGSWQVFSTFAPASGIVGRVFSSNRTAVVTDIQNDPDYISLGPPVTLDISTPIRNADGSAIGALNIEFPATRRTAVDVEMARIGVEAIAEQLSRRIAELGGPPPESRSEMLARHGLILTTAATEPELAIRSLQAAQEVSGLDTPVLVLATGDGYEVITDELDPSPLAGRVKALPTEVLIRFSDQAHDHGSSYSLGDPAGHHAAGFETLTEIGVRTMIAVPVGAHSPLGGVLLLLDERASRPDPETIALISLLAAQAWSSRERIRTLEYLHERALSDPLTGLRHQGSFGERLASATPGNTAVFAIDIDSFKTINDTYGHQAGDRALVALAQALSTALRTQDELYRIGGDEFAAIVEVARSDEAVMVADRLVAAARSVGHTISVGVAIRRSGELSEETLSRADSALYLAKRSGRDGVRVSP